MPAPPPPGAILRAMITPYLHLDDPWVVDVSLAAVVGNTLPGDPLWLLLVNPASSGKTELVQMFRSLEISAWLAEVTENTFLSGLQRQVGGRSTAAPEHSLLFRWTDPKLRNGKPPVRVMLVQDLTGLITKHREKRDEIFGQLRQIYDGRLVKSTGMGDDLLWEGYLGLFGAVTPKIDEVAELNSSLGERFVLYRPFRLDQTAEARAAAERDEDPEEWRAMIAATAARAFERAVGEVKEVTIHEAATNWAIDLAQLTALGRAPVSREGYTKLIRLIPEAEGPARLTRQFSKLLKGLCAVRRCKEPGDEELATVTKVARDSIPTIRLQGLRALYSGGTSKKEVAARTGLPPSTVEYLLQDLLALGVTKRDGDVWSLDGEFLEQVDRTDFLCASVPGHETLPIREWESKAMSTWGAPLGTQSVSQSPLADFGAGAGGPRTASRPEEIARVAPAERVCTLCGKPVPYADFRAHVRAHAAAEGLSL